MSRADNGGFRGIAPISKADSIRNEPHPNEAEAGTITPCNLSRYRIFTTLLPNSRSQQKRCDVYHLLVNDALGSIPVEADAANLLFRIANKRFQQTSTISI